MMTAAAASPYRQKTLTLVVVEAASVGDMSIKPIRAVAVPNRVCSNDEPSVRFVYCISHRESA